MVFKAVAVYVTAAAPWQRVDVAPGVNTGVPTFTLVVTVCVAEVGPLQPCAVAVITDVPDHAASKVTSPVAAFIELPPVMLAASRLYVIAVLFAAVAVYVITPAPIQRADADPPAKTGVATFGVIIIAMLAAPLLHASVVLSCALK